jgi:hypothetical protein
VTDLETDDSRTQSRDLNEPYAEWTLVYDHSEAHIGEREKDVYVSKSVTDL